ncbi:MAG: glycosyltransferase [Deltaproteobacteria bacterium]|nr:glycosyltransferase [Deltaproteobacteria bacterium]
MTETDLSIIIPAKNESSELGEALDSIAHHMANHVHHEVIVVDNGSTDDTVAIAKSKGAKVISREKSTIAGLRNAGVEISHGNIILFMDADVRLTKKWGETISDVLKFLHENPRVITGSRCLVPEDDNLFLKYWFSRMTQKNSTYINSGHMITTRKLFDLVGGFTENMITGEDYNFGQKALLQGGIIIENNGLQTIHTGYPKTCSAFINRERWHGTEDFRTWKNICASREATIVLVHIILVVLSILIFSVRSPWSGIIFYFLTMPLFLSTLTIAKFGKPLRPSYLILTSFIFYLYIIGRSLSLFDRIRSRP